MPFLVQSTSPVLRGLDFSIKVVRLRWPVDGAEGGLDGGGDSCSVYEFQGLARASAQITQGPSS
jgi:hypothetical protein